MLVSIRHIAGINKEIISCFEKLFLIVFLSVSQEPGKMEAQMAEVGTAYVMKNILTTRQTGPPILPKGEYGTGFNSNTPDKLPSWLTEDDLAYFVSKFEKTGFVGGLNYYRNLNL